MAAGVLRRAQTKTSDVQLKGTVSQLKAENQPVDDGKSLLVEESSKNPITSQAKLKIGDLGAYIKSARSYKNKQALRDEGMSSVRYDRS
jgi:hypothetical protein